MLNHYETVTLLVPEFSDKEVQKYVEDLTELLTRLGAVELSPARVERRPLAYPIKKHTEGHYVFIRYDAPTTLPDAVRTEFKHREGILRLAFIARPKLAADTELPVPPPAVEETGEPVSVDEPDTSSAESSDHRDTEQADGIRTDSPEAESPETPGEPEKQTEPSDG